MNSLSSSKFFKMLKTLSEEELKQFDLWLRSPWSNSNKNLVKLLDKVKKYHPDYDHPKLTKEKLFKQVLPNGKFSDRRMNNLLSEGFLAAEQFIIFQNLKNNENLKKDLLTRELQNRHLEDWFFKDIYKEIERLEDTEIKDWEDHLDLVRLNRRAYHHPNPRKELSGETIIKMGNQLNLVYVLEKAAIINEKFFRKRILKNENYNIDLELKRWLLVIDGIDHLAVALYKMRFIFSLNNTLENYYQLRKEFLKRYNELNIRQQKTHLLSLINDTAILVKANRIDITESLPLYKLGLKINILLNQGVMTYTTYTTIVSISNFKNDFDFTKEFIDNYWNKLNEGLQLDALNWARAHTLYYKKELTECLDILLSHDFQFFYFKLITKLLTTQVYFDLHLQKDSYQSYLFNYFDSFEKWVQREKFRSKIAKNSFLRFIQTSRLIAKENSQAELNANKLEKLLVNEKNIQALNWLIQKKEEIIKLKKKRSSP